MKFSGEFLTLCSEEFLFKNISSNHSLSLRAYSDRWRSSWFRAAMSNPNASMSQTLSFMF